MLRLRSRLRGGIGVAATPYTPPAGISGVVADFDFTNNSTISQILGSLTEIRSLTGSQKLYQNDGASCPTIGTRTEGGYQVADFDGVNDFLIMSSGLLPYFAQGTENTVVIIGAQDVAANDYLMFVSDGGFTSPLMRFDFTGTVFEAKHGDVGSPISITHSATTHFTAGAKTATTIKSYYDALTGTVQTITNTIGTLTDGKIGKGDTSKYLDGHIRRILVYNRALNDTEISTLRTTLMV